jgi:tRNA uridine 5-carboxymethylaminomethyl modification enzyme
MMHTALAGWTGERQAVGQVVLECKYAGYVNRQAVQVERFHRMEARTIPNRLDFALVPQLRAEARDQWQRVRPLTLGQASRVSGITPADLAVLLLYLDAPAQSASPADSLQSA